MGYVQIITTGGTIASLPNERGSVTVKLTGDKLIESLTNENNVRVINSLKLGSYALDFDALQTLAKDVNEAINNSEVKGIVITHGTDTIEETAYYLSLVVNPYKKPIILTGAQLDSSYVNSDGTKNLNDAITLAKSNNNHLGVVVNFSGFVYCAKDVRKIDTNALEGFGSPGKGPVARIDGDNVFYYKSKKIHYDLKPISPKKVCLIRLGLGFDDEDFKQMTKGYSGVVIEAFGRGNAHPSLKNEVKKLIDQQIPVIITSRCVRGAVKPVYGNGGGKDLEEVGAWFAGDLSGEKARILLGTLLANELSWDSMYEIVRKSSN